MCQIWRVELKNRKINILGTKYEITADTRLCNTDFDGICKNYVKSIQLRKPEDMLDDDSVESEKQIRYEEILRHELVHAFFFENGLDEYSENEQLVNWIAIQFPKMVKAFQEAGCL